MLYDLNTNNLKFVIKNENPKLPLTCDIFQIPTKSLNFAYTTAKMGEIVHYLLMYDIKQST